MQIEKGLSSFERWQVDELPMANPCKIVVNESNSDVIFSLARPLAAVIVISPFSAGGKLLELEKRYKIDEKCR
jgi:hypothetical protein